MEHFATKEALATWSDDQTGAELVAFYNALPGATPTKRFTDRKAAVDRIWKALHVEPMPAASEGAADAPRKLAQRTRRKATARKGKRPAPAKGPKRTSRDGGRVDEVLALLRRAGGVTKSELMKCFGWLDHTTRGFISRLGDVGYKIESLKAEGGKRTYKPAK